MTYYFIDKRPLKPIVKKINNRDNALNYLLQQDEDKQVYLIKEECDMVTEYYDKQMNSVYKLVNNKYVIIEDFEKFDVIKDITHDNTELNNDSKNNDDKGIPSYSSAIENAGTDFDQAYTVNKDNVTGSDTDDYHGVDSFEDNFKEPEKVVFEDKYKSSKSLNDRVKQNPFNDQLMKMMKMLSNTTQHEGEKMPKLQNMDEMLSTMLESVTKVFEINNKVSHTDNKDEEDIEEYLSK